MTTTILSERFNLCVILVQCQFNVYLCHLISFQDCRLIDIVFGNIATEMHLS